jgi:DNA-binding phage protein
MSEKTIRRKTRAEAFENSLTPEQLSQLYVWCGRGFKVAQLNAFQEWGLKLSPKMLNRWFHKDDDLKVLSFIASGASMNQKIEEAYQRNPEPQIETLVKLAKTLVMQLSVQGATDPEKLKAANFLMGNVLDFLKIQEKAKDRAFNETKFKESLKTKLQSGLDAVAEAFKGNAEAINFYQRARSMIERETK